MADALPRFVPVADHAVLVELASGSGDVASSRVRAFDRRVLDAAPPGVVETVPAYVNVLVVFDPLVTDHTTVIEAIAPLARSLDDASVEAGAVVTVEVCYDADLAPDLDAVAAATGRSVEEVIELHLSGRYRVEMFGFQPGAGYLRGVPGPLQLPRKPAPVPGLPAGTVIVAGPQCMVTTLTMPTGWWAIGRSPARIFTGDDARPTRFDVGDDVRFARIDRTTFDAAMAADA